MEIHPTEMSQGEDDYYHQMDLQRIFRKIYEGAQKTESISSSACINRVPEELRKLKESAYTPRLVAIGPLHQNDRYSHMHHVKLSYTKYLLSRLAVAGEDQELTLQRSLKTSVEQMKTLLDDAKKCYAEEVTLLDEEMLLVDGCFILEFLYRCRTFEGQQMDVIFDNSLTFRDVQNDLILLENQIPFFVLEKLFQLTLKGISNRPDGNWSLSDYVWWCYRNWISPGNYSYMHRRNSPCDSVHLVFGSTIAGEEVVESDHIYHHRTTANYSHILHYLHYGYLRHDQIKQNARREEILMPSASELIYAGIKFVPDPGNDLIKYEFSEPKGLFSLFCTARFKIPQLVIHYHTESFLRNLIAFEQSCPGVSNHVSSYAVLMGMLVNTDTDVRLLEKAGVLRNYLGPTEVATYLFRNLSKETFGTESFFAGAYSKATEYSSRYWPSYLANLRRQYSANPWRFITVWISLCALVVSFLQYSTDIMKNDGRG